MLGGNVIRLFQPSEGNLSGLKLMNNSIYAVSSQQKIIFIYSADDESAYCSKVKVDIGNPAGITIKDEEILVADSRKKAVYRINSKKGGTKPFIDLSKLDKNDASGVINARNSKITDIEYHNGKLWISCEAGYSSCIICIDTVKGNLMTKYSTRGPSPASISLDNSKENLWVLDSSNKEISVFDKKGNWTGAVLPVSLSKPSCFSLDTKGHVWLSGFLDVQGKRKEVDLK
ncbi:MAG TPA: hypothetical protein VHT34_13790 [Clostridia bacterium]|nr:hypothetical protein [Clostridia bacterium]